MSIEPASLSLIVSFVSRMKDPSHAAASVLAACRVLLLANTKGQSYIVRSIRTCPHTLCPSVHLSLELSITSWLVLVGDRYYTSSSTSFHISSTSIALNLAFIFVESLNGPDLEQAQSGMSVVGILKSGR